MANAKTPEVNKSAGAAQLSDDQHQGTNKFDYVLALPDLTAMQKTRIQKIAKI